MNMADLENKENKEPENLDELKEKENIDELKEKIQYEIESARNEGACKDQCIRIYMQEEDADKRVIKQYINQLTELEQNIYKNTLEQVVLKKNSDVNTKRLSSLENIYLELVEKYKTAKYVIQNHVESEQRQLKKLENIQNEFGVLERKHASLKDIKKIQEQARQEKDHHKLEMIKLESEVKKLEIKITSLETALKQKLEECSALYAVSIAGKK